MRIWQWTSRAVHDTGLCISPARLELCRSVHMSATFAVCVFKLLAVQLASGWLCPLTMLGASLTL